MESINPIEMYGTIKKKYLSFILTSICRNNISLEKELKELYLNNDLLWRDLMLQSLPEYKKADSEDFNSLNFDKDLLKIIKNKILPYIHQIKAWKNILENKNCVIATGTGSGKTEGFLFPIINNLITNENSGVKAIIIYPLKALARDQGKRVGEYLDIVNKEKNTRLKYAILDGDSPENSNDYLKHRKMFREMSNNKSEIHTREEMLNSHPDILITNYVMLERIFLNPKYNPLLSSSNIEYIVLDEIHYYRGAQGIDVSLLIRRLQFHLYKLNQNKSIKYIGTSATLGGKSSEKEVLEFLFKLFNSKFNKEDIIEPEFSIDYLKDDLKEPQFYKDYIPKIQGNSNKLDGLRTHAFFCAPPPVYRCLSCGSISTCRHSNCNPQRQIS